MIHDLSGNDPSPTVVESIYSITERNPFLSKRFFAHGRARRTERDWRRVPPEPSLFTCRLQLMEAGGTR